MTLKDNISRPVQITYSRYKVEDIHKYVEYGPTVK